MDKAINFPNLGIYLNNVGQSFSVFGFEIAYYGIAIVIGMLLGLFLLEREAKRVGEDSDRFWYMGMIVLAVAVVGARIYYVVFEWRYYQDNLLEIFNLRNGGLAIYGGIIFAILAIYFSVKKKNMEVLKAMDCWIPGLLVGQIIGRWGNFFNREVFGGYTNNIFAMQLPVSAVRDTEVTTQMLDHIQNIGGVDFIQVHPTFLYEGFWNLGLLILIWLYRKHKKFEGELVCLYLIGYGIGRWWIEGIRTDQLLIPGIILPVSQVLSLIFIVIGVVFIIKKRSESKSG